MSNIIITKLHQLVLNHVTISPRREKPLKRLDRDVAAEAEPAVSATCAWSAAAREAWLAEH